MKTGVRATVLAIFLSFACLCAAQTVSFNLVHVNDVHDITPAAGGKGGGIARLATLKKQLLRENPNTFLILAGDYFSPSAIASAKVDGKRLAGKHMVDLLNAVGLDFLTFGNHEFDLSESEFKERMSEVRAKWASANVRNAAGERWPGVPDHLIFTVKDRKGNSIKVGIFGVTINSNKAPYVSYRDAMQTAREQVKLLRPQVDVLIALTHQGYEQDQQLVATLPIDLLLGGHDHENMQFWRGPNAVPMFKADANLRSTYVHKLHFDIKTKKLTIDSKLVPITPAIPEDAIMAKLADQWMERGFAAFRQAGFEPKQHVADIPVLLDGREAGVRNGSTNLTELIGRAFLNEVPGADASIYNSGSIRFDDVLPAGPVTQYDVIRVMPFGGNVVDVQIKGDLLEKVLNAGRAQKGKGGWLQTTNVTFDAETSTYRIGGAPLDPTRTYRVAVCDFLMRGGELGIEFLTRQAPGVISATDKRDIRFAVIEQLKRFEKAL
ncbi:MAG TPA: bifunctional UDP-sugar hydrolase/5'-nucleotidase [Terriglobales bacterium]|nr:bifunctional UDP-sugar hydrolase/5'-nucleotidase [Terriglobales bacterium]